VVYEVLGLNNAISISAGGAHTCSVLSDQTVKCWGSNQYGQLGNNGPNKQPSLNSIKSISGLTDVVQVSAGFSHTCAILKDDSVKCWGRNDKGQLGIGSNIDNNSPQNVEF